MDLDGKLGVEFFNVAQPQALTIAGTPGNIAIAFDDISQLTNKDYTLQFNSGAWQLSENDTDQVVAMTGSGTTTCSQTRRTTYIPMNPAQPRPRSTPAQLQAELLAQLFGTF